MATIGSLGIGASVNFKVNGELKEFIIVHQGNPDNTMYDSSCDGTWLLMKDVYEKRVWDSSDNDYANSNIHAYLNGTFLGVFDSDIQSAIKQVKIPYQNGTGSGGSVASGSSGLSTKIFLLSGYEVGWTTSTNQYFPVDGACLGYFSGTAETDSKRIGYYEGTAAQWWLRSPNTSSTRNVWYVGTDGYYGNGSSYNFSYGVRPALILPSDFEIPVNPAGKHNTLIDGVSYAITKGTVLKDGVAFNVKKGRTLVDGVGYDINIGSSGPQSLAELFSDATIVTTTGRNASSTAAVKLSVSNYQSGLYYLFGFGNGYMSVYKFKDGTSSRLYKQSTDKTGDLKYSNNTFYYGDTNVVAYGATIAMLQFNTYDEDVVDAILSALNIVARAGRYSTSLSRVSMDAETCQSSDVVFAAFNTNFSVFVGSSVTSTSALTAACSTAIQAASYYSLGGTLRTNSAYGASIIAVTSTALG